MGAIWQKTGQTYITRAAKWLGCYKLHTRLVSIGWRYLLGVPRLVQYFVQQKPTSYADGYADANHAGCLRTRVSTGCTVLMHGCHMIRFITGTQTDPALSSGESEWYGLVRCATNTIGLRSMAADFGLNLQVRLTGDATAASGIAHRRGAGKLRHVETKTLWLQRLVTDRRIIIRKEDTKDLVSDIGTKHVDSHTLWKHLKTMGFHKVAGKSKMAFAAAI